MLFRSGAKNAKKEIYEYVGQGNILPRIMVNVINGGRHANNNLEIQEFMIVPINKSIKEQIRISAEVFHTLKDILKEEGKSISVGDEGGFAPELKSNEEALDLIMKAIKRLKYEKKINIALDVAASEFYDGKNYIINGNIYSTEDLLNYYIGLKNKYPIISIEDPFYENDYKGFKMIMEKLGKEIQIVGDDLFVTKTELLQKGVNQKTANTILLKPNQVGTYTEMLETIKFAKENKINTIISHRSGETENTIIPFIQFSYQNWRS